MRLAAFMHQGRPAIGVADMDQGYMVELTSCGLPDTLDALLRQGAEGLEQARAAAAKSTVRIALKDVEWLPPLSAPSKSIAVGLNYVDHASETSLAVPEYPVLFNRFPSSWVGHDTDMQRPAASDEYDYEGELVVVIGKGGRHISKEKALEHVYGYSVFNDGSVRDFQMKSQQWMMGKNFDRSGSFGPYIVTPDELPEGAKGLRLVTRLNGEVLQDANTSDMIFDVATLIATVSVALELQPGDIIISGTPAGVGFTRNPPVFMKPGDLCEIEIEQIGTLTNRIIAEV